MKLAIIAIISIMFLFPIDYVSATHISKPVMTMDETSYNPGETVEVKGWVEYNNSPTSNVLLEITIRDPNREIIAEDLIWSDANGNFLYEYELSSEAPTGTYLTEVTSQCRDEHRDICTNQTSAVEISVIEASEESVSQFMTMTTDDGSVRIELLMDHSMLEINKQIQFSLEFFDASTGERLEHVNHSFKIIDQSGEIVVNSPNVVAYSGAAEQVVVFSRTGTVTLTIEIHGVGVLELDDQYSGTASTTLTVVPEFAVGITLLAAAMIGLVLGVTRLGIRLPKMRI